MATLALPALLCLLGGHAASGAASPATGWNPVDSDGVRRHAALGLFGSLRPTQARVTKDARNPLFEQDQPWETRIDNGYPNVVFDENADGGPWRLWYGLIGDGGQYLLYANSSDGIEWQKPNLGRYDLSEKWKSNPAVAALKKSNNIVMFGGGLGILHDTHESDPTKRYKISGGAPAGCYSNDGASDCVVGTAASPDGIADWTDVEALAFPAPWKSDCHTNIIWDEILGEYIMTTRDLEEPQGREISIARTGGSVYRKNGTWALQYSGEYPHTTQAKGCFHGDSDDPTTGCAKSCLADDSCLYFWVYTKGSEAGTCCLKTSVLPGSTVKPACDTCGGEFYAMGGDIVPTNATHFDAWSTPLVTMRGTVDHQLYSQITWRFYDVFLGIVMTFDATNATGHVHCMLSWSNDSKTWGWVDEAGGLDALKEFIPAGPDGSFDSHICFAAHVPMKMPDGSSRVYYMGGNGPHDGKRNSSFALATLPPDRFAGVGGGSGVSTRAVEISGSKMIVTVDVGEGGSFAIGVVGEAAFERSRPITASGTDVAVEFPGGASIAKLDGLSRKLQVFLEGDATVLFTVGFANEPHTSQ